MLEWTGERYLPWLTAAQISYEHLHRYLSVTRLVKNKRVLDVACGEGYGSALLARTAQSVVGVDIDQAAVTHAEAKYTQDKLRFLCGDATCIPLSGEQLFDVIVSFETLEHIEDHQAFFGEAKRLLAPDGILIVSTPNKTAYSDEPEYNNPFHVKELYFHEFRQLCAQYFKHAAFYGQRISCGSSIWPLTATDDVKSTEWVIERADQEFRPLENIQSRLAIYYLAAVSDCSDLLNEISSVLSDESHLLIVEMNAALQQAKSALANGEREIQELRVQHGLLEAQLSAQQLEFTDSEQDLNQPQTTPVGATSEKQQLITLIEEQQSEIERLKRNDAPKDYALLDLTSEIIEKKQLIRALTSRLTAIDAKGFTDVVAVTAGANLIQACLEAPQKDEFLRHAVEVRGWAFSPGCAIRQVEVYLNEELLGEANYGLPRPDVAAALPHLTTLIECGFQATFNLDGSDFDTTAIISVRFTDEMGRTQKLHCRVIIPRTDGGREKRYAELLLSQASGRSTEYMPLAQNDFDFSSTDVKLITFYLPQFHPIPENDQWWGKGFTEWTNVSKAVPQFIGHYQPRLPGELGFYDLRMIETQRRQIELAKKYGIYGFCFYHYWFNGQKLLDRPLRQMLANPDLDFPFCLCWANENWTRRWDGSDQEILVAQSHSPADDLAFIKEIEPILRDRRYIKIEGRPLLLVYRPGFLPDPTATVQRWRDYCQEVGVGDLYLIMAQYFGAIDPRPVGFDAAYEFPPHQTGTPIPSINHQMEIINPKYQGTIADYTDLIAASKNNIPATQHYTLFKGVCTGWDNEARRPGRAYTLANSTPASYQEWLTYACQIADQNVSKDKKLVFINAWNEWAEGAYLEPDRKYGYSYLQATANALLSYQSLAVSSADSEAVRTAQSTSVKLSDDQASFVKPRLQAASLKAGKAPSLTENRINTAKILVVSHDAHLHGAQLICLNIVKTLRVHFDYEVHLVLMGGGVLEPEFNKYAQVYDFHSVYDTPVKQCAILERLYELGICTALCNTLVSGSLLSLLKSVGFQTACLVHELPSLIKSYHLESAAATVAQLADKIIFPADYVRQEFTKLVGRELDQAIIRPQGLYQGSTIREHKEAERQRLRAELNLPAHAKIVLAVGFADLRKGVDIFAQVAAKVCAQLEDAYFLWVGNQQPESAIWLQHDVAALGLANRLLCLPARADIGAIYGAADVYLLTSREDPFPSVVLEAMSAGLTVIAFDKASGIAEMLRPGRGILTSYLDVDAMAEQVRAVLLDDALRCQLGEKAAELVNEQFSFLDYTYDLLKEVNHDFKKVSVVIPNYNYEAYLDLRLRSVFTQTYPIYEVIFLDDASTDGSIKIVEDLSKEFARPIKVVVNDINSNSVFLQWQKGISVARGDFVWIAEADDFAADTFLEKVMAGFDNAGVVLSYCQSKQIDENGNVLAGHYLDYTHDISPHKWKHDYIEEGSKEITSCLAVKNTIPNVSAVVFRRSAAADLCEGLSQFKIVGDWLFYIRLLSQGKIAFCAEALNHHRRHQRSVVQAEAITRHFQEILDLQAFVSSNYFITDNTKAQVRDYDQRLYEYFGLKTEAFPDLLTHPELKLDGLFEDKGLNQVAKKTDIPVPENVSIDRTPGYCPICEREVVFSKIGPWLRDQYFCEGCGSIPRFRALIDTLNRHFPNWRELNIHESSPGCAASDKLRRECQHYVGSYYYVDVPRGQFRGLNRSEDLERQTFFDGSFDLVITQDVMEHVLDPAAAFREIARTLKPGGAHVFTVPWYYWQDTKVRAVRAGDEIKCLYEPEYHGNPIDESGALVVTEWGWDLTDFIYRSSGMITTVVRLRDLWQAIEAEFMEIFISYKR